MDGQQKIRAAFLNLGTHMWGEYGKLSGKLDFDYPTWIAVTERLQRAGGNMIVLDVGEGAVLPHCPELSVKGSWRADRIAKELDRLKAMGIETIPKLNFSATHDAWLGEYSMMLSTPEYYRVCEAAIRDVVELFGKPRFVHLGFDEETPSHQRRRGVMRLRQGDLWWHDLEFLAGVALKAGARPWIWSDYIWRHEEEFLKRMSKDVVQSNWYYGNAFRMPDLSRSDPDDPLVERALRGYIKLDRHGFDQVPCGSIWSDYDNFAQLVDFCERNLSRERCLGYMMAAWFMTTPEALWKHLFAIDVMEETFCGLARGNGI